MLKIPEAGKQVHSYETISFERVSCPEVATLLSIDGLCHFGSGKPISGQQASLSARIGGGDGEAR